MPNEPLQQHHTPPRPPRQATPAQIIILGFLGIILAGALLLMLPVSSQAGVFTPFPNALFTATSATCVTGLVVHDTATYWSPFGHLVLLVLIQTGGMGVVTVAVAVVMCSGRRIGLRQRWVMQESISAPQVGGIVRMTSFILKAMLLIEGTGALLLSLRFCPQLGLLRGLWYGIFHSISAFCNAGFDLMGTSAPYSSLTGYVGDPLVWGPIALLILVGGLGFLTWHDLWEHRLRFRAYRLQSKLILVSTAALLLLSFLFFQCYEFRLPQWAELSGWERLNAAAFQAVTPPHRRLQLRGPDPPERARKAGHHPSDAGGRLPRLHRRRLQGHHAGGPAPQRPGRILPPRQPQLLWAAVPGRGPAQCQRHLSDVSGVLPAGRNTDLLYRRRPPAGRPL